jgi:hypothetical protein
VLVIGHVATRWAFDNLIHGANQQWTVNPNGTIVGVQSGRCLDVTGQATTNGTLIEIWTCTAGPGQTWTP